MSCDLCGKVCGVTDMTTLMETYRVPNVMTICRECEKKTNDELWRLRRENSSRLKAWLINERRRNFGPQQEVPKRNLHWYSRFFCWLGFHASEPCRRCGYETIWGG